MFHFMSLISPLYPRVPIVLVLPYVFSRRLTFLICTASLLFFFSHTASFASFLRLVSQDLQDFQSCSLLCFADSPDSRLGYLRLIVFGRIPYRIISPLIRRASFGHNFSSL